MEKRGSVVPGPSIVLQLFGLNNFHNKGRGSGVPGPSIVLQLFGLNNFHNKGRGECGSWFINSSSMVWVR